MEAYINSISCYLPERIIDNEELIKDFPQWDAEKVSSKTGILKRHVSSPDETAADLAEKAARQLFKEYVVSPGQIDFILLCTQSPDYFLPTTACILQQKLNIPTTAGALDYNLGCSGYVYGLALAKGLILSGTARNVLLLTAETYSKYIHSADKGNRSLFGDGAAATLISTQGLAKIGNFVLGTDGLGAENLIVKTGASREKKQSGNWSTDEEGNINTADYLYMNGPEIFSFTLQAVPPLIKQVIDKNNLNGPEAVDYYVLHQANKYMLNTIRKVCNIPAERFYINLENTANTVSSTLPIALQNAFHTGLIKKDMEVLIAGFGVGYSWGGCMLKLI